MWAREKGISTIELYLVNIFLVNICSITWSIWQEVVEKRCFHYCAIFVILAISPYCLSVKLIWTGPSGTDTSLVAAPSFGPSCSILNLCTSFTVIMYNSNLANLCPMQALRSFGQTFALRPTWHHGPTEGWQRSGRCAFDRCLSTTSPAGTFPGQKSFRGCWTCCDPHAQQLNPWGFHTRLSLCRPDDRIPMHLILNQI